MGHNLINWDRFTYNIKLSLIIDLQKNIKQLIFIYFFKICIYYIFNQILYLWFIHITIKYPSFNENESTNYINTVYKKFLIEYLFK